MFAPFVLVYTFLLISAVRCSTNPEPTVLNITDEVCLDSGFWTDWFSMYNAKSGNPPDAESTYNTLMNIANASCSAIAGIQVQQIVQQMNAGTHVTIVVELGCCQWSSIDLCRDPQSNRFPSSVSVARTVSRVWTQRRMDQEPRRLLPPRIIQRHYMRLQHHIRRQVDQHWCL